MEDIQMKKAGTRVVFKSLLSPQYPDNVIVPSAITLASVPASVESNPPLKVPRESLDDMTLESSDKFTPEIFSSFKGKKCVYIYLRKNWYV